MPNVENVVTVPLLNRFLTKVKELIGNSGASITNAVFAQKSIEAQADMIYDAISEDGVSYTATVPGITELYAGLRIQVRLSRTSASTGPTLNVNGLGAKGIRAPLTTNNAGTTTGVLATWLSSSCPVYLTYTGSLWKTEFVRPSATSLYGSVKVENGGTGANTAAKALENLGGASVTYVDAKIAELQAQIDALK